MANAPVQIEFNYIFLDMVIEWVEPDTFLVLISVNIVEDEVHEVLMHASLRHQSVPEYAHVRRPPRHIPDQPSFVNKALWDVDSNGSAINTPY